MSNNLVQKSTKAQQSSGQRKTRSHHMHPTPTRHQLLNLNQRRDLGIGLDLILQPEEQVVGRQHHNQRERNNAHGQHARGGIAHPRCAVRPLREDDIGVDEEGRDRNRRKESVPVVVETHPLPQQMVRLRVAVEEQRDRNQRESHHRACEVGIREFSKLGRYVRGLDQKS
jgi:hypothetical protein